MTRFTIDGSVQVDSATAALAEAKRMIYVSPADEARAIEALQQGKPVMLIYGFKDVCITPPGTVLPGITSHE